MKTIFIIVISALLLSGCTKARKDIDFGSQFADQQKLTLERLQDTSLFLGKPQDILVLDDYIILQDPVDGYWFALIDKKNGKLVKRFGIAGRGPGEILTPTSLKRDGKDFTVHDQQLRKLLLCSIDSLTNSENGFVRQTISLELPTNTITACRKLQRLSSGDIVGTGVSPDGRLVYFDANGKNAKFFSPDYPYDPLHKDEDYKPKSQAFQYDIAVNPRENRLCNVTTTTGQFEIFEFTPTEMRRVTNTIYYLPIYENRSTANMLQAVFTKDSKYGFSDLEAAGGYIWFTNMRNERLNNRTSVIDYIGKFDWDGKPVKGYKVDNYLRMCSIDPDGQHIYGVSLNAETMEPELVTASIN